MKAYVVVNRDSGTLLRRGADDYLEKLERDLAVAGYHSIEVFHVEKGRLQEHLDRIRSSVPDLTVAIGGDGTISAVAHVLAGTQGSLAIIPTGTFNLIARDLGIPLDLESASRVAVSKAATPISMAEINGRHFLSHAVLGMHTRVVRERERIGYETRLQKIWALLVAYSRVITQVRPVALSLTTEGNRVLLQTPLVVVAPGEFTFEKGRVHRVGVEGSDSLHGIAIRWRGLLPTLWSAIKGIFKARPEATGIETITGPKLVVRAPRRIVTVAVDGELIDFPEPLEFRIRPSALRVLLPATLKDA